MTEKNDKGGAKGQKGNFVKQIKIIFQQNISRPWQDNPTYPTQSTTYLCKWLLHSNLDLSLPTPSLGHPPLLDSLGFLPMLLPTHSTCGKELFWSRVGKTMVLLNKCFKNQKPGRSNPLLILASNPKHLLAWMPWRLLLKTNWGQLRKPSLPSRLKSKDTNLHSQMKALLLPTKLLFCLWRISWTLLPLPRKSSKKNLIGKSSSTLTEGPPTCWKWRGMMTLLLFTLNGVPWPETTWIHLTWLLLKMSQNLKQFWIFFTQGQTLPMKWTWVLNGTKCGTLLKPATLSTYHSGENLEKGSLLSTRGTLRLWTDLSPWSSRKGCLKSFPLMTLSSLPWGWLYTMTC